MQEKHKLNFLITGDAGYGGSMLEVKGRDKEHVFDKSSPGDVPRLLADNSKVAKILNWKLIGLEKESKKYYEIIRKIPLEDLKIEL